MFTDSKMRHKHAIALDSYPNREFMEDMVSQYIKGQLPLIARSAQFPEPSSAKPTSITVTRETFHPLVSDRCAFSDYYYADCLQVSNSNMPVLLAVTTRWCAFCKVLKPSLAALATYMSGMLRVAEVRLLLSIYSLLNYHIV